ncbi:MAG: SlyX protein [Pseudohongiellaceae bacterium]|jgi:SlyX protein
MDSNSDASSVDDKFTDLELKYSFQENTLAALNDALVSQQRQLDSLKHELALLKQHLAEASEDDSKPEQYSSGDERPPHY